jgi:hypothetical protein
MSAIAIIRKSARDHYLSNKYEGSVWKSTRGHNRSTSVVVCDIVEIVESAASHREVVRLRENGTAVSRSGARPTSMKVAMRGTHEEDPGSSVVAPEVD